MTKRKRKRKPNLETAEELLSAALAHPSPERSRLAIQALDAITDIVLAYRPKARSKPAVQRKRRKTILEKQRTKEKP